MWRKQIEAYELVYGPGQEYLEEQVNRYLKLGWELYGNPWSSFHENEDGVYDSFYQPMIRYVGWEERIDQDFAEACNELNQSEEE